ncbi:mitochondrial import inner membrane translocase subunit TIM50 isoform X2 [Gossypium raimondii]|uniref:mitochondrial import inner membrane translocase subunit TIM50 isoform X2 n=1 Tax=Gossypium raimondii TaxID=29730 RepID=UPI00227D5B83|nr:mitochondrial import inner membrane translocase subunit TIM50 isoform X2 [Gossypium raimondii]
MSSIVLRSRTISNNFSSKSISQRGLCSGVVSSSSDPSKGTITSSQSILSDQSTPPPPAPKVAPQVSGGKIWSFVKYGLIAGVTGTTGYAGYLSYKCSCEEVDHKAKALRAAASYAPSEDASAIDKYGGLLYSAAMTVPAKALESYLDLRRLVEEHLLEYNEPTSDKHLPDLHPLEQHVFTLVLDLNETLLYTDWKRERGWRTFKRPGVDAFLEHLAKFYEIVVYSDQMNMYVDSVCEMLDTDHCIRSRLSRGATKYPNGKHYGDLSKLNRDPTKILYVSAHAFDSSLKPENCVPIKPFKLETDDTALLDLIPFLEYVARNSPADIRQVLQSYERKDIAKEFLEHSKEYQRRVQEQKQQGRLWQR